VTAHKTLEPDTCVEADSRVRDARRRARTTLNFEGAERRGARPSRGAWLAEETAGWRWRPNRVSGLDFSANGSRRQSAAHSYLMNAVPWRLPGRAGDPLTPPATRLRLTNIKDFDE